MKNTDEQFPICPACGDIAKAFRCETCDAYVIEVTANEAVLTINKERTIHFMQRRRIVALWRQAGAAAANWRDIQPMKRAHFYASWNPADKRRRDPANAYPTIKAIVDGMVEDAKVLPDDDHHHLIGPDMRIGPIRKPATITIAVIPLTEK